MAGAVASTSQSLSKLGVGTLWILRTIQAGELPMCVVTVETFWRLGR